jgi:hypothetical protein
VDTGHPSAEFIGGHRRPAGSPEQRVELDVREAEPHGELPGQGRLAGELLLPITLIRRIGE